MLQHIDNAIQQVCSVVIGKKPHIKLALTCLCADGHLLIEDLPGMGKTSLSHALAKVLGLAYSRAQFTSDLLPADLLGVNIFDQKQQQFAFHPGPVFSQLLLADEINRASPKTQSALLEAMEEHQVSVDGTTHQLPKPFFVIATQNPSHQSGTYPLPESQLDRFLMRIELGYPDWQSEKAMLQDIRPTPLHSLDTLLNPDNLLQIQQEVQKVQASDAVIDYILRLVTLSRESELFPNPLSPRASKALLIAAKSWCYLSGRDFVVPEDVQAVLPAVAEHRLRANHSDTNNSHHLSSRLLELVDPLAA